jgi:hypothetical protein
MLWTATNRIDKTTRLLADRHYNRQKPGTDQFVPPGRCLVLHAQTETGQAFWVTSWPFAEYVKHAWAGAWVCSAFRNEGAALASHLILQAIAATQAYMGEPPDLGMITFVDRTKIRGKRDFGYCYLVAGFEPCGKTKGGLLALQMLPSKMPPAETANGLII